MAGKLGSFDSNRIYSVFINLSMGGYYTYQYYLPSLNIKIDAIKTSYCLLENGVEDISQTSTKTLVKSYGGPFIITTPMRRAR